ncbi:MAG: hypothetical protein KatS3mg057_1496 [Herpetosiphonaceae bacterium]|nr:MAG: hypothetical protein KatS3mg057_1496 [Herpetosiphonaceae bacterium]
MAGQDEATRLRNEAIHLIRTGEVERGRQLLEQIVQQNPNDEYAWLWLSSVVPDDQKRRYCLERVLSINPQNEAAQRGLAKLPPAPPQPLMSPIPAAPQAWVPLPPPYVTFAAPPKPRSDRARLLIALGAVLLMAALVVGISAFFDSRSTVRGSASRNAPPRTQSHLGIETYVAEEIFTAYGYTFDASTLRDGRPRRMAQDASGVSVELIGGDWITEASVMGGISSTDRTLTDRTITACSLLTGVVMPEWDGAGLWFEQQLSRAADALERGESSYEATTTQNGKMVTLIIIEVGNEAMVTMVFQPAP